MRNFKVRDFRNKQYFIIDDAYLNGYAKHLGVSATVVYLSLCRHADKDQTAFPSQELIALEHNMSPRTVWSKLRELEEWGIVKSERTRSGNGKWLNNTYFLLDKSEWKKLPFATIASGQPFANDDVNHSQMTANNHSQPLRTKDTHTTKDTHIKETHIPSYKKFASLKDITEIDMQDIADQYKVSLGFVKLQYEKMCNWIESSGKKKKNYKATLRNFVLSDIQRSVERRTENGNRREVINATQLRKQF